MAKNDMKLSDLLLNRELSWLEFNDRVLQQGKCDDLPLMERLKFLSIVSSNLDEFFMIRVADLRRQQAADVRKRDAGGFTVSEQLSLIAARVREMVARQTAAVADVLEQLAGRDVRVVRRADWVPRQREFLAKFFRTEVQPVLTPMAVEEIEPCPLLPGLQLFVALLVTCPEKSESVPRLLVVPVPGLFPRFVNIPWDKGTCVAPLEEILLDNAETLIGASRLLASAVFRITRDGDVTVQDARDEDLLETIRDAVTSRKRRDAVRLEISARPAPHIIQWLTASLALRPEQIYEVDGLLDAKALMQMLSIPSPQGLAVPDWPPQTPRDLVGAPDLWTAIRDQDILLFHPYESFEPVIELVSRAAEDPNVLAIKQTLYRPSADSPIVQSLVRAAENGKEVTVLVELRARFDEAKNVLWARRMEDAGCHVIYGIAGFKTHAKALLVIRRESGRIRRYVHLATGNYNERTARLYTDLGLMTCDEDLASDVAAFFNLLTGLSETVEWRQLAIAPTDLRRRFTELIEREIQVSTPDRPGLIMAKMNALEDKGICEALCKASQAGVKILLNVRGICCLRPGVEGVSQTIHIRSIVDRFLEHSRVYYFANGGHEEVYLASADWMKRNLDRRLEILFPIRDARIRQRLIEMLRVYFEDNVKACELLPDGEYRPVPCLGQPVRAQEKFYEDTLAAVRAAEQTGYRFRPLTHAGLGGPSMDG